MSYLHPRDMDAEQPMIEDLPLSRKFKSYIGLKTCAAKFEKWINDFSFIDLRTAASIVDWTQAPIVDIRKPEVFNLSPVSSARTLSNS
jgi:hypothetical protein